MSWERYENGTRVEHGDDATRTVTTSTGTRPYTAAENAAADQAAATHHHRRHRHRIRSTP